MAARDRSSVTPQLGTVLTLEVERPTAGGQMLARHEGQIVFLTGAIPGERVRARVARVAKGVVHAELEAVERASPDRRVNHDARCGGHVLGHVVPERQRALKAEIIVDAFRRLARHPLATTPEVMASPEHGYRMRARLQVKAGCIGFVREGSHELCDAASTGQLHAGAVAWIGTAHAWLAENRGSRLTSVELVENIDASQRACHLELGPGEAAAPYGALATGLVGLSAHAADTTDVVILSGVPVVHDEISFASESSAASLRVQRSARAFFQGNRFLLEPLVQHVMSLVPAGPVLDLYAGVGLFGLAGAARGSRPVTLVEGDWVSGEDLVANATPFAPFDVEVLRMSVEQALESMAAHRPDRVQDATVVVDPPRTGLSPQALSGLLRLRPRTVVYVSCDVATLARDARALLEAGFAIGSIRAFDLFPNTAHIETVVRFDR
jgi:23S rRNA (uracil1939-C5)-methyltransferase